MLYDYWKEFKNLIIREFWLDWWNLFKKYVNILINYLIFKIKYYNLLFYIFI